MDREYSNPYRSPLGVKRKTGKALGGGGDLANRALGVAEAAATRERAASPQEQDRGGDSGGDSATRAAGVAEIATARERVTTVDVIERSNLHLRENIVRPSIIKSRERIDRSLLQLELIRAIHRQDHVDVAHLIRHGADVKQLDANGECPMRVALQARQASEFHWPIVKLLAEHGADSTTPDANGITPLMIACRSGSLSVVMALFANANKRDLSVRNKKGENCLFNAVRSGSVEVVQFISSRMNPYGIQRQNITGDSVFHLAAMFGQRVMLQHLRKNEGGRLDTLMKTNKRKWSPLHYAVFGAHLLVIRQLLKWGVPELSAEETRRLMRLGAERSDSYVKEGIPMATATERTEVRKFLSKRREMKARKVALFGTRTDEKEDVHQEEHKNGVGYQIRGKRTKRNKGK